jgi:fumarylacetoacetase
MQDTLNDFISDGQKTWRLVRNRIAELLMPQTQNYKIMQKILTLSF